MYVNVGLGLLIKIYKKDKRIY